METDDELQAYYAAYEGIEDEFLAALDESRGARGPEMLNDLVEGFGLPAGAAALDVGCGQGLQALDLAGRFGFVVTGVDPIRSHIEQARASLVASASGRAGQVSFELGRAEALRLADDCIEVGLEWGECGQEHSGKAGRRLLHAARLLREPERYKARFGDSAYDIMLADCLWHVYRLLGKMSERVYVLSK